MRRLSASVLAAVAMIAFAGLAQAEDVERDHAVIELTQDQIAIIVHNCPQDGEITIELTEDQVAIIVHNFPQVEVEELTLGRQHISREDTVELVASGRTGVAPVEAR